MGRSRLAGAVVRALFSGMRFIETPVFTRIVADLPGVPMNDDDFEDLVTSVRQAGRIRRGEAEPARVTEFAPVDVRAIRERFGKSQAEFARMIGVSVAMVQDWEHDRRRPEGPAYALLKMAAANPEFVSAALSAGP